MNFAVDPCLVVVSRLAPAESTVSFFDGEPSCKIGESDA